MTDRSLTKEQLRRAVLTRQLLVDRATSPLPRVLERIAGLQSQYAPTMYVGLWSRLAHFARRQLDDALERRVVVQGTLMRATIHLVSAEDYWPFALAVRGPRRRWWLRATQDPAPEATIEVAADRARRALADNGSLARKDLEQIVGPGLLGAVGFWLDLVRVPPSGTWDRRRADLYAAAEDWLGVPPALSEDDARDHLVRSYLRGFGPASAAQVASWAGTALADVVPAVERVATRRFRGPDGEVLVDGPRSPHPAASRTSFPCASSPPGRPCCSSTSTRRPCSGRRTDRGCSARRTRTP